jgi:excisionase family DNA binding protein
MDRPAPTPPDESLTLSLAEVCRHLGVHRDTLHELRRSGTFDVPTFRIGRQVRVRRVDLERWLARQADDAQLAAQPRRARR